MDQDNVLKAEEAKYKQAFLQTLLRWALVLLPLNGAFNLVTLVQQPSWGELLNNLELLTFVPILVWSYRRIRRGEIIWSTRVLIAGLLLVLTISTLSRAEDLRARMSPVLALVVLLATFLDRPQMALTWAAIAAMIYVVGLYLPNLLHIPTSEMTPSKDMATHWYVVGDVIVIAVLARVMTRHLRGAIEKSESARRDLERANVSLLETQSTLSGTAANLERSNQELGSFAYVVSHDLRAPLRALNNYSRFLQEDAADKLDPSSHGHVQGIIDSARHMDALVGGLLEYSRIGRIKVGLEQVDVRALLERVAAAMHLGEKADVKLPASAPTVWASPVRLEQIFANLLDNAVKFQQPGVRPVVAVEWADRGSAWEFAVRDNGIGIEKEHFDKVFVIFQRLQDQAGYAGTGVGLAVVQKAVQERGGQVWIESTPGQGSVFRFTVPHTGATP